MQLGISLSSTSTLPGPEAGRHLIRRARAAAAAELDSLTVGDSHARSNVGYFQNTPTLGRVLAEWSGRPAGCLFNLPMWPPVLVAEQVGTLACLHDGPFVVQAGLGTSPRMFAALGASRARRGEVFEESVRVVRGLLAGETVSSERFGLDGLSIGLVPAAPVDWWFATSNPAGLRRAARFGAAWYVMPDALDDDLRAGVAAYRAACDEHGTRGRVMLRRDVLVLADEARARSLVDDALGAHYRGRDPRSLAFGGPGAVADQLAELAGLGVDQVVVRTMAISPETDLETIEALGEVRRALAALG